MVSKHIILAVDPDEKNLLLLREALDHQGCTVYCAHDGPEALGMSAKAAPDLILLAVSLPCGSGMDVCRALKANPAMSQSPVLLMAAFGEVNWAQGIEAGAADFVSRPIQAGELVSRVTAHLSLCAIEELARTNTALAEANAALRLERSKAETALRQSEGLYRKLVETANEGIWLTDSRREITFVNQAMADMLGYLPAELVGRKAADFLSLEDMELLERPPGRRYQSMEQVYERPVKRKGGGTIWTMVSWKHLEDEPGLQGGAFAMFTDITKRKRTEEALRQWADAFEHCAHGIALCLPGSEKLLVCNPALADMLGQTVEDMAGIPFLSLFVEADQQRITTLISEADHAGQTGFEASMARHDRSAFPVQMDIVSVRDAGGKVLYRVATAQNITDRKRLEAQLRQAQKLEAIGQLAGGVAHDFNNILAAMMMHMGLLQMNPDIDTATRECLQELDAGAQRAASLTRQLLMFSRRSVLSMKSLDLNQTVANVMRMLTRLIPEDIELRFESTQSLPCVEADAGMMEQVLVNLVVNARDAMPSGGSITIGTRVVSIASEDGGVDRERRPGCYVRLEVLDTGCGMDDATLKRIFEPFFTTKEIGKGSGLGLATVHGIVAQHRGWIEVESEMGRGSRFHVFLPIPGKQPEASPPQSQPTGNVPRGHETVLVAEDDAQLRQLVSQTLRALGYRVFEAGSGEEVIKLWYSEGARVDLLLTDMVMPEGVTGLEVARHLCALKPSLKVIISSGYSADLAQKGIGSNPGLVYLPKPYEAKTLAKVVRDCLDGRPSLKPS